MDSVDLLSFNLSDYYKFHHRRKFKLISDFLKSRFDLPDHKHKIIVKCFYNFVEIHFKIFIRGQIKDFSFFVDALNKGRIFDLNFKSLGSSLRSLKSSRSFDLASQRDAKGKKKEVNKKGVYVLLSLDYKKRLDKIVKSEKTTITALLQKLIDSELPEQKVKVSA